MNGKKQKNYYKLKKKKMTKELEKYPAYEKWLMRECKGNKDAMFFLLHGELMKQNEIVFEWLEEDKIDLIKISSIIINRNK